VTYETSVAATFELELDDAFKDGDVEWMVFFSPSDAEITLSKLKTLPPQINIAASRPTTEEYLRKEWNIVLDMVSSKLEPSRRFRASSTV
jgi:uroporphyrinogen-III synthase